MFEPSTVSFVEKTRTQLTR